MTTSIKLRLVIAFVLLTLSFIGVIITDIKKDGAWEYWRFLCVVFACLSLALSWHLRRKGWKTPLFTLWHELAHWIGLLGGIFVASYFVRIGFIGRFEASLLILLLLALATYLVGVYTEPTFILLGIILGVFAAGLAFLDAYLYNIILPLTLVAGIILFVVLYRSHKKSKSS